MRTRSFTGPPANEETGPLRYTQQVAAFETVDAAVAETARLVQQADDCGAASGAAGPHVSKLPVGVQSRRIVFAEGGDYSIGGFFRRGNAVAVVQGGGGRSDTVVRDALRETFDRMCVYDRPEGC